MNEPRVQKWFIDDACDEATGVPAVRSILAAADLSQGARHAVDRAVQLSAQLGARATLLTVDGPPAPRGPGFPVVPSTKAPSLSAHRTMSLMARELTAVHGLDVQAETRHGDACEQILLMSGTSDLLVMAPQQRHALHRWVFGSIEGRLLGRCRVPMLLVKQPPRGAYRRVLALTDFSARSIAAAGWGARLATEAELHLFHAIDPREETEMRFAEVAASAIRGQRSRRKACAQIRMERALEACGASSNRYVQAFGHGDVVPLALLKQHVLDADLLVVAQGSRSVARSAFLRSIAHRLSDACACDVLVVPTREGDSAPGLSAEASRRSVQAAGSGGATR